MTHWYRLELHQRTSSSSPKTATSELCSPRRLRPRQTIRDTRHGLLLLMVQRAPNDGGTTNWLWSLYNNLKDVTRVTFYIRLKFKKIDQIFIIGCRNYRRRRCRHRYDIQPRRNVRKFCGSVVCYLLTIILCYHLLPWGELNL